MPKIREISAIECRKFTMFSNKVVNASKIASKNAFKIDVNF